MANEDTDSVFASLTGSLVVDEHLERREKLRARAAHLRAEADALDAEADLLGTTHDDMDCKILPSHFGRDGDVFVFTAPLSEREKLRRMIPGMRARSMRAGIMLAELRDRDPEALEVFEDMDEGLAEIAREGLVNALLSVPSVATVEVVARSIDATTMSSDEMAAWLALFTGMLTGTQARMNAAYTMAEMVGDEIPDDAFDSEREELAELTALCDKLNEILDN